MKTVADILRAKGRDVFTIASEQSVYDALVQMARLDVGALVVLEEDAVIGLLSERDYARKVILRGETSKELPVARIMSRRVTMVGPEETVEHCMALMTEHRVRHLPVLEDDRLAGLVSIGDVVKALIDEREFVIEQLEGYIKNGG